MLETDIVSPESVQLL